MYNTRAGTLDQQQATIERVSKEIGALLDLVEENEAKGRVGQVRARRVCSSLSVNASVCAYVSVCLSLGPRVVRLLQLSASLYSVLSLYPSVRLSVIFMVIGVYRTGLSGQA